MNDRITIVAGLPRSGTSLMMSMLDAGGLPCVADNKLSFEDSRADCSQPNLEWIGVCCGRAVKLLEPLQFRYPRRYQYDFIVMRRNAEQQAKSQVKFLRHVCRLPVGHYEWRRLAPRIEIDIVRSLEKIAVLEGARSFQVNFETLLTIPDQVARGVKEFLGREMDVKAMAAKVRPRTHLCYPGFMELELPEATEVLK